MWRALPLLFVLVVAGCFGGGGSSPSVGNGESLVLAQSDVGSEFGQFDRGKQLMADLSPPRDDPSRFGRKGGWKARFSRPGTNKTQGPLVISSLADLFGTNGGAHNDFELYKNAFGEFVSTGGRLLSVRALGDEAQAVTYRQGIRPNVVRYYLIAWRDGAVTASINVNGFDGKLTLAQTLDLAGKQERRIRAAAR